MNAEVEGFFHNVFNACVDQEQGQEWPSCWELSRRAGYENILSMYERAKDEGWSVQRLIMETDFTNSDICTALGSQTLDSFWDPEWKNLI